MSVVLLSLGSGIQCPLLTPCYTSTYEAKSFPILKLPVLASSRILQIEFNQIRAQSC